MAPDNYLVKLGLCLQVGLLDLVLAVARQVDIHVLSCGLRSLVPALLGYYAAVPVR
jgi:hypothetical protein